MRQISRNQANTRRKRKSRRSSLPVLFVLMCASIWLMGAYVINGYKQDTLHANGFIGYADAPSSSQTDNRIQDYRQAESQMLTFEQLAEISNGYLLLVNNDYAVPSDIPGKLVRVSDYVSALVGANTMNEDALVMLRAMFDFAASVGFNEFRVTQGFRTQDDQQLQYDTATDKSFVALPGHSEHQTGLAADISYNGVNIANSRQGAWLMENAHKYGFILRCPQHKTDVTGVPFEPWHYRYVGQPHARFMHENDLVLEEYLNQLKSQVEVVVTFAGIEYRICYLSDANGTVDIPQNHSYSASLDNMGGLIVTVWESD